MAVHTPWQSRTVAMIPPLSTCRGPAAWAGEGVQRATASSPSHSLFRWRPSALSAPQPQQWLARIWSWKAVTPPWWWLRVASARWRVFDHGVEPPRGEVMPLFMDVHHMDGGVSAGDVAKAHQADVETQGKHGVEYKRYWVDEGAGK